jgi:hypothetical protein
MIPHLNRMEVGIEKQLNMYDIEKIWIDIVNNHVWLSYEISYNPDDNHRGVKISHVAGGE